MAKLTKKLGQLIKKDYLDYVLILAISLITLTWFEGNNHILGAAFGWRVDFFEYWQSASNTWLEASLGYGGSGARQLPFLFPFIALGTLFQAIFNTSIIYEMVYFYFFFALSGISAYLLLKKLNINRVPRLMGAFFYMMNPFAIISVWSLQQGMVLQFYAALPLGIYLLMRSLEEDKFFITANLILLFIGVNASYTNPTFFFMFGLLCFAFAALKIGKAVFEKKEEIKPIVKRAIYFGGTLILLNLFWIIPFLFDITTEYAQADHTMYGLQNDLDTLKLNSTNFFNIFRLTGFWALAVYVRPGEYYFPWFVDLYLNPFVTALTFILPIIAVLGVIFYKKSRVKYPLFWIITFLFLLFTIAGLNSPFSESMENFYNNYPFLLRLFRQGYNKFGIIYALSYTVIFSFGLQYLYKKFKNKILILVIPLFILALPIFMGTLIYHENQKIIRSSVVDLPQDYLTFHEWESNNNLNARYLEVPLVQGTNTIYNWEKGYNGMDLLFSLSMNPVVFSVHSNDIANQLVLAIKNNDLVAFNKLLPYLNIQKIIVNHDICNDCLSNYASLTDADVQQFMTNFEVQERIGSTFDIINNDPEHFLQRAYIPVLNIYSRYLNIEHFGGLISPDTVPTRTAVFFKEYNIPKQHIFKDDRGKFAKIEPVKAEFQIETLITEDEDSYQYVEMNLDTFRWIDLAPNNYTVFDIGEEWFTIVRIDGLDSERSKSFRSIEQSPYDFPDYSQGYWNTKDSTLIYLSTGAEELAISGVTYENKQLPINSIWWDSGWVGMGIKDVNYPVVIPSYQDVIIQVDEAPLTPEFVSIERGNVFSWDILEEGQYTVRNYSGWKNITNTNGSSPESTISFATPEESPFEFPSFSSTQWNAFDSTLIYIKTGDEDVSISSIHVNGRAASIAAAWWETGWMGMMTSPVELPIVVPKHQKAIVHLEHVSSKDINNITLAANNINCDLSEAEIFWPWLEENMFYINRYKQTESSIITPTNKVIRGCLLNDPNSSYVYVKTGDDPLYLADIKENGKSIEDIFGAWWDDGGVLKQESYRTMRKGKHLLPVKLPPNKNIVFHIQHTLSDDIEIVQLPSAEYTKFAKHNPTLEYKQISKSKYRFRISNVTEDFPLVLNERYHDKWDGFVKPMSEISATPDASTVYESKVPVYDPFEMDDGMMQPYDGDGYVSKKIEGSMQNDNLPDGWLFENKGYKVPDGDHFVANGYANAWWIDIENLCGDIEMLESKTIRNRSENEFNTVKNGGINMSNKTECNKFQGEWNEQFFICELENGLILEEDVGFIETTPMKPTYEKLLKARKSGKTFCSENADGSYNVEIVVEFRLQKLFYFGLFISGLTLVGLILLLFLKRKK